MADRKEAGAAAIFIGLVVSITGVPPAIAGSQPAARSLEVQCPSMASWQLTHPHPEPGQRYEIKNYDVTDKSLQKRLIDMYNTDEKAGDAWANEVDRDHPDQKVLSTLQTVRKRNLQEIKSIVAHNGVPTTAQVGKDGVWAAFSLIQHADSDHEFQKSVLEKAEVLYERKEIPGEMYAYLTDRVRVAEGKRQLYGTQFQLKGSDLVIRPVEDPSGLEDRRRQADLPTMADYKCYVSLRSGKNVHE